MNRTQLFSVGAVVVFFGGTTLAIRTDRDRREKELEGRLAHFITPARDTFEPSAKQAAAPLSLTASDGRGLVLTNLTANVVVEEPLAFTEMRLVFDNPADRVIEGTFSITLPPGASVGRFAMKLGDMWQEGEVVEKQAARRAYEDFLHRKQDPALLEQGPGNEFTARVFPIPARGRKELVISYSQELAGRPFVLPLRGLPAVGAIEVRATNGRGAPVATDLVKMSWLPTSDFVVEANGAGASVRAGDHFVGRVHPSPASRPDPLGSTLFLFDTSASRALGFEEQIALLQRVLKRMAEDAPGANVSVACFDQTIEPVFTGPAAAFGDKEISAIRARGALGASNVERALAWARDHVKANGQKRVVLLGDGVPTAGATEPEKLAVTAKELAQSGVERIDAIVLGGIRDEALLRRITTAGLARDGAVLDGQLSTASLGRRLAESTRSKVPIVVEGASWSWPTSVDGVQAGDEIVVYADVPPGKDVTVLVDGTPEPLATRTIEPPLVERAWAKAKIESLVAAERVSGSKPETQKAIVDLSVRHRVTSPYTSYLVLETEEDYARFKIDRNALTDVLAVEKGRLTVKHRSAPDFGKLTAAKSDAQRQRPAEAAPSASSMIDLLNTPGGGDPSARGNMWGDAVGDAFGAGGLGLSGVGEGGGGRGEGIGLGNIGTIGHGAGTGTGQGFGSGHGRLGGSHASNPPTLRMGNVTVSGRLPPEVVQRIVRQNFGRFRLCYEQGLRANPNLGGRVTAAFSIDPTGAVVNASDGGSDLPDSAVVSCVTRSFRNLSFPQPEGGGVVSVRFPIVFAPGELPPPGSRPPLPPEPPVEKPKPVFPYTGKFKDVMDALARKAIKEALDLAVRWRVEAPGDVMALTALGEVLETSGDVARAERAYGSIIDLFASRADLRRFAGVRLEHIAEPAALDLALDSFEKAVAERPDHPQSHRLLAYALLRKGDPAKAFEAAAAGARQQYPSGRFAGVDRILKEDLGLVAAAWRKAEPKRADEIEDKLKAAGGTSENGPSIRFVLNWETDANDVDFHIYDDKGGHAYYSNKTLPSGGELYADVTTGYGPECFTIRGPRENRAGLYTLQANYFSIGPMGYGMGKLEIIDHDGKGGLSFEERPYIVMVNHAFVDLGTVKR